MKKKKEKTNNDLKIAPDAANRFKRLDDQCVDSILNSISDLMLIVNKNYEIIWNNKAVSDQYGCQIGKKCFQFLKADTSTCSTEPSCLAEQTFLDQTTHCEEYSMITLTGERHHYLITFSPMKQANQTSAVLLTFTDITENKRMKHDISQLKELNEEIIKIVPIGMQLLDTKFQICFWNPAMEKMMGISNTKIHGKKLFDIFPIIKKTEMITVLKDVLNKGNPFFREVDQQPKPDGSIIYTNLSIFPLKDSKNEVTAILICMKDITEHKFIENKLEKKAQEQAKGIKDWEKRFHDLVENSLEGIGIIKGTTFTYLNPGLAKMLGYDSPQKLIGKSLKVIHPDNDHGWKIIQKRLERKKQKKSNPVRFEIKALKKDDSIIDMEVSTSEVFFEGETTTLATYRDITEKKKLEDMEKKLHLQILHSDRLAAMGRFAAGVAHEINNPLAVLSGRIQELLVQYKKDEELERNFASMKRVCDRIGKIVDSLLYFSKQKEEPKYLYDVNEVIEDAISMFERQTQTKGVRLIKRYTSDLPPIVIIAAQIQQVIVNMLINAIDATGVGDMITISTKLDKRKKNLVITFKDTGCGIPTKYLKKVFEPFFTTKGIDKGSGLGLSISSGIVKNHNGSIRVRSKEGSGTIFTITLPLPTQEETEKYSLASVHY